MTLYRAIYATRTGHTRRMTFAACDSVQAQRIASGWKAADDKLADVVTLRPLQDQFKLTSTHEGAI